jgi:hypothetical protein
VQNSEPCSALLGVAPVLLVFLQTAAGSDDPGGQMYDSGVLGLRHYRSHVTQVVLLLSPACGRLKLCSAGATAMPPGPCCSCACS